MSELLASYWRSPNISGRTTKTAYLDLFDNGISANIVLFVDRFKLQLPKWVLRDFLSLAAVMYPDAPLNRRENPNHVLVEEVMKDRLAGGGFRYNPGHAHTSLPDARTDPIATLEAITGDPARTTPEHMSRADLARAGNPGEMHKSILADIAAAEREGVDLSKRSGVQKVIDDYGWADFEVLASRSLRNTQRERNALRTRVAELEGER